MPKRRNGNGNGSGNGHATNGSAQVDATQDLEKAMREGFAQFADGFAHLNARMDAQAELLRQTNEGLKKIVVNTGEHWRSTAVRRDAVEERLKKVGL